MSDDVTVTMSPEAADAVLRHRAGRDYKAGHLDEAERALSTALVEHRKAKNPMDLPWTAVKHADDDWEVRNCHGDPITAGHNEDTAKLLAAAHETCDALAYAYARERTSAFDYDEWAEMARTALRKSGRLG